MDRSLTMKAFSAALAVVSDDPRPGIIDVGHGWAAEVVNHRGPGADRQLQISRASGGSATLMRFARQSTCPAGFPRSIGFIPDEVVWAGEQAGVSAAVWIRPSDPAQLAASVVTASVGSGWDIESHTNMRFPRIRTVSLRKNEMRRAVSIISGNVVLNEKEVAVRRETDE